MIIYSHVYTVVNYKNNDKSYKHKVKQNKSDTRIYTTQLHSKKH